MKALVIGATGLLGYGVTKQLYRDGWEVRAIGRENVAKTEIFSNEIEYISGNFYSVFLGNYHRVHFEKKIF